MRQKGVLLCIYVLSLHTIPQDSYETKMKQNFEDIINPYLLSVDKLFEISDYFLQTVNTQDILK